MTTTTTFMAPAGACERRNAAAPLGSSSSHPLVPSRASPAAPAPPARNRSRRVRSDPTTCLVVSAFRYVDRSDRVLVGKLAEHFAGDLLDIALVVAEVVQEGLERSPRDLELRRREVQAVRDLVGTDQVKLFICHAARTVQAGNDGLARGREGSRYPSAGGQNLGAHGIARELPGHTRPRLPGDRGEGAPPQDGRADRTRGSDRAPYHRPAGVRRDHSRDRRDVRGSLEDLARQAVGPGSVRLAF